MKFDIPTIEIEKDGFKAVINGDMLWEDYSRMCQIKDKEEAGVYTVKAMIKSWNMENADGSPAPVTEENIKRLPRKIGAYLSSQIQAVLMAQIEKKKTSRKRQSFSSKGSPRKSRKS